MRSYKSFRRSRSAFTLIELLVVIGIIAILAGMILAGVQRVKARGAIVKARYEVGTIAAAITQYETDYGQPPVSQRVWDCSKANAANTADFSYSTSNNVSDITRTYGNNNPNYITTNAEVIAVLRNGGPTPFLNDLAQSLNPKKKTYLDAPTAINNISGGVGTDGVFRDPWGTPYIISVDLDSSGTTVDGLYGRLIDSKIRSNVDSNYPREIPGSVLVWSAGPDGRAEDTPDTSQLRDPNDPKQILRAGFNEDNILSWDK